NNAAWCYFRLGELDKAEEVFKEAANRLGQLGDFAEQQTSLGNLGSIQYVRKNYRGAIGYYKQALDISERLRSSQSLLWLTNLASSYFELRDLESAESANRRVLDTPEATSNPLIGILPLITAAQIAFDRGHLAEAKQLFDQALSARDDDPGRLWTLHA